MITADLLKSSSGNIIVNDTGQDILQLPVSKTLEKFKSFGMLFFRGFNVNYEQMKAFAEQFSSTFMGQYSRPIVDLNNKFITLVDSGMHYIAPHCENANSPFRPDVVWFCCAVPAAEGGETLFWDGVEVWKAMSEELKQLFLGQKVRYVQKFLASHWQQFLGAGATINDVKNTLEGIEGLNYKISQDESLILEYVCSAVVKTKYGDRDAFANSIISEYRNPRGIVTFANGSAIPVKVINEIQKIMDNLTGFIPWMPGDLVMIDNSRFLHGRKSFNDGRRRIMTLLSDIKGSYEERTAENAEDTEE
ncbi:MAG: TauD/TfdA family dioxygenase [Nostoc sp. ChiSLP01]|nr:TauD/TfdA family dioxygenase [Nostoc sp. CmiSLP01]MDZ8282660.1 TauD/TfdA family dioxygenase [Nostoc sp. ChiSLP01]